MFLYSFCWKYEGGLEVFGFIKETSSYGIEKMYFLYIFLP
jgi:hypothetical protein